MARKIVGKSIIIGMLFLLAGCATKSDLNEAMHKLAPPITLEPDLVAALGPKKVFDSDGDGQITSLEIKKWIEAVFHQELQRADLNDDGQLSEYELTYARTNAPGAILWTGMDADGNGTISRDEFTVFTRAVVDEILQQYDSNGDQLISQTEFLEQIQQRLTRLDMDKDGLLERSEVATTQTTRAMDRGHAFAEMICGPGCVWYLPGGYYGNGSGGYQYEPISTFCDRYPNHSVCPSTTHPGCTNEDVNSGNCHCPWPDYCEPFF